MNGGWVDLFYIGIGELECVGVNGIISVIDSVLGLDYRYKLVGFG